MEDERIIDLYWRRDERAIVSRAQAATQNACDSGGEGYSADTPKGAYARSTLTQVIDPQEVTALLFYSSPGDKQDVIEVPLR